MISAKPIAFNRQALKILFIGEVALIVEHQLLENLKIGKTLEHIQDILIDLVSPLLQKGQKLGHVEVSYPLVQTLTVIDNTLST